MILPETIQNSLENSKKAKDTEIKGRKEWLWPLGSCRGVCKALILELGAGYAGDRFRVICFSSIFMGFVFFSLHILFHDFKGFVSKEAEVGGWLSHHKVRQRVQSWGTKMSNQGPGGSCGRERRRGVPPRPTVPPPPPLTTNLRAYLRGGLGF